MGDEGIVVVNRESNIALVTLWAKPRDVLRRLPGDVAGMVNVAGVLYSRDGVNHVVVSLARTLLNVDTLIVYGPDLSGSGQALVDTFSGRCGEWLRVPCDVAVSLGVRLVDLRGAPMAELERAIRENFRPGAPPRRPIHVELGRAQSPGGYMHPTGWGALYDVSLFHLWVKAIDYVLTYGYPKPTEAGDTALEAALVAQWGLWGRSPEPDEALARHYDVGAMEAHARDMLDPQPPPDGVAYRYGHRFRGHIYGDQLEAALRKLASAPHTRRAVMATWAPGDAESGDPPCIVAVQFVTHGDWLSVYGYLRSNDMYRAWPANIYALARLGHHVAERLGEAVGVPYRLAVVATLSASAHVYSRDVGNAARLVEAHWRAAYGRDVFDPRGNYTLGDKVAHYYPDGTLYRELDYDRTALRREAAKLMGEHAFYLGEEHAARALLGDRYRQEGWRVTS